MTKINTETKYYVFIKQGYDRMYYCVAGREINLNDAVCFLTNKEAYSYAESKNQTVNESGNLGQRETGAGAVA